MLGKVMKHEIADTGKIMLPLTLSLLGCGLLGMLVLRLVRFNNAFGVLVSVGVFLIYVLACSALEVTAVVYLSVRFYKSMFGSESYLTHTLPVSNMALYHGKLLIAAMWQFVNMIFVFASAVGMGYVLASSLLESTGEDITLREILNHTMTFMGFDGPGFVIGVVGFSILSAFAGMIAIYACMAVGQLFEKHKILAFVVSYVILYLVEQVISTVTMVLANVSVGNAFTENAMLLQSATFMDMYGTMMKATIIESLIYTVICYVTGLYICNKKLNIE
ncbi:MAG: hypothetical protein ACI4DO_10015 [Roseburia sp.]